MKTAFNKINNQDFQNHEWRKNLYLQGQKYLKVKLI